MSTGWPAFDAAEAVLEPVELVAVTVKVYVVPLVSEVMVADVAGGDPVTVDRRLRGRADVRRDV